MKTDYVLKHKDVPCALISIAPYDRALKSMSIISQEHLPYLGEADLGRMKLWWKNRSIPGDRKDLNKILALGGCETSQELLVKNLALSVSDAYWICPTDMNLRWEEVKLQSRETKREIVSIHNSSYDGNASLGGQLSKYWDMNGKQPILVKIAGLSSGQQAVNEAFASLIHKRQNSGIPYVNYWMERTEDNDALSKCCAFTTENKELVSAYEILNSRKKENSVSLYDEYISICSNHGSDRETMQRFMDYQTLSDFVISNTDRHLMNFGILRDTDTLRFVAPTPIFDSGNSMFYSEGKKLYTQSSILERKITSFHDKEESMLKHVQNKGILREELLPSPREVQDFYASHGIPEEKSQVIAANYNIKRELLHDFQKGKTISFFVEERNEKQHKNKLENIQTNPLLNGKSSVKDILNWANVKTAIRDENHKKSKDNKSFER